MVIPALNEEQTAADVVAAANGRTARWSGGHGRLHRRALIAEVRAAHASETVGALDSDAVYLCCMGATRTQVYLTEDQRRMIDEIARAEGVTLAEVIRRALDVYLDAERDPAPLLAATFGAAPDADVPSRDEWERG